MLRTASLLALLLPALAACTSYPQGEPFQQVDECGAADLQGLIGYPLSSVGVPGQARIISPGRPVIAPPYVWERLNVVVRHGTIIEVICG